MNFSLQNYNFLPELSKANWFAGTRATPKELEFSCHWHFKFFASELQFSSVLNYLKQTDYLKAPDTMAKPIEQTPTSSLQSVWFSDKFKYWHARPLKIQEIQEQPKRSCQEDQLGVERSWKTNVSEKNSLHWRFNCPVVPPYTTMVPL